MRDGVENVAFQTEHHNYCKYNDIFDAKIDALHDGLGSFKKFIFSEVAATMTMILTSAEMTITEKVQESSMDGSDLVECLKDRIKSLEKQLDNKQHIIESLIAL